MAKKKTAKKKIAKKKATVVVKSNETVPFWN